MKILCGNFGAKANNMLAGTAAKVQVISTKQVGR